MRVTSVPEVYNLLSLMALLESMQTGSNPSLVDLVQRFDQQQSSTVKSHLKELLIATIVPIGDEIRRYSQDMSYIEQVLQENADIAAGLAEDTMQKVRQDFFEQ